jgi:hypothetical protein
MWYRLLFLTFVFLLLVGCGGGEAAGTAVPTLLAPADSPSQTANTLPPTFTPEPVEFAQPTAVTPAPTPTEEPATAVPEIIPTTAAGQPDALQFLVAAEVNLRRLDSFSHERSITIDSPIFDQTDDISCVLRSPDQAFCHAYRETTEAAGDVSVRDFEFVQRSAQIWARNDSQSAWEELPPDDTNYLESYVNQLILSPSVTDAFIFGEAAIEGVNVYEIRLTLEPLMAVQALYEGENLNDLLAQAQDGEATARVWIGQDDSLLRLLTIEIRFNSALGEVSLNGIGTLANFNQTADIPQP